MPSKNTIKFSEVRTYFNEDILEDIKLLLDHLKGDGLATAIIVNLTNPEIGIPVVRAVDQALKPLRLPNQLWVIEQKGISKLNKPIIFLGPSLGHEKARKILEAEYRPPAKKGDFLRLAGSGSSVNIVGLVDGLFLQDYPPTPIEVYQLVMKKNTLLVGAGKSRRSACS